MKMKIGQLAACVFICAAAMAQVNTSSIFGRVTDSTGASIANADVIATNLATNQSRATQTKANGQYLLDLLPIGKYQVEVKAPGFKRFIRDGIVLDVNQNAYIDTVMDIGAVTETILVTAGAPLVNVDNPQIGRTVDNAEITELPLVNRNVYTLLSLTPGVESNANSIVLGYPEQRTIINGGVDGGAGSVNYYLDGGTNMTGLRNTGNIAPNPDSVQEFRVITNSYSAEFGRFAGGIVNVVTKSGGNDIHGSLFEFLRNDKLNAAPWNLPSKPPLHRNQFGGTVGGPIRKEKTFYFGSYSGLRQIESSTAGAASVPTALERQGDFSQSKVAPIDPLTGKVFPGGLIPLSRFDPTALNILNKYVPLANAPNSTFLTTLPKPYNSDEFLVKVDHALTSSQNLSFSYFETSGNQTGPVGSPLWSSQRFDWRQHNANASYTAILSPSLVNQFWVNYTRSFGGRLNLPAISLHDLGSQFQVQGTPSLPQVTVTGYFTLGESIAGPVAGTNFYTTRNILSWTRGRHSLKFGGEMWLEKDVLDTTLNNYGTFTFNGSGGRGTNALASFLLGLPTTMNQDSPVTALDNGWYYGLFVQDDFRIRSNLMLNLGLRWDLQTPLTDPYNREDTFVAGVQSKIAPNAPVGLLFPGDPGVGRGIIPARKHNFSPRIGLAWDPFGNGKTSIRAAAGLFYGSVSGNEWNTMSNQQPFSVRQQFNDVASFTNPYGHLPGGVSPYPYNYNAANPRFLAPSAIVGVPLDFQWPYSYQLNFSVQREIVKDLSVTAAYVGTLSHRLPFQQDINYPIYGPGATTANVNNRRPMQPGVLSTVSLIKSIMGANYNALQISAEKRFSKNLSFKSFYTYSKTLDNAQLDNNTTAGGAEDMRNLSIERGRSDFDRHHNSVTSLLWRLDYFTGQSVLMRSALNGWELSVIAAFRSGAPLNVTAGSDVNLDGNNNDRPNLVGNPYLDPNRSRSAVTNAWFNTAAFAAAAPGADGTAGRNILDGPGIHNIDLGIFRNFKIYERMQLQFRAELTNAFNLVNLGNPNLTLTSNIFGHISTGNGETGMRQVQMGLRLVF